MTRARALPALFASSAVLVIAACWAILRSQAFGKHPDVLGWAVTFDLTLTVPLLYWLSVVKTGRARALTVAPVFLLSMALAAVLVPRGQQAFLRDLRFLGAPMELLLLGALAHRVFRASRDRSTSPDPYERIYAASRIVVGEGRAAEVVASEAATMYYALFCWRKQPAEVEGQPFTVHERSGWGTVVACILVLLVAESIGLHLLVQLWSTKAAWIVTFFDVWGILWLLGDYHGLRLRRSSITDDALELRYGLRWSATIPRTNIAAVTEIHAESEWKRKDVLKVAMLDEPRWLITLHEPVTMRGMAGLRKTVRAIALLPDGDFPLVPNSSSARSAANA
jgi:hypothetical protein